MHEHSHRTRATRQRVVSLALMAFAGGAAAAELSTAASTAPPTPTSGFTTASCHEAVTLAVQKARGRLAQQLNFDAEGTRVTGQGRYQGTGGTRTFTYQCLVEPKTGGISGVVFSETGDPPKAPEKPWQADMTHLSPEACEAAAAAELRAKIPRLFKLELASSSRQLRPAPKGQTYLHGQGSLQRAEGMNPTAFTYRCELDSGSGKLISLQTELLE